MKLGDQKLQIGSLPFNERGEKIEPEEQPAKIVQSGSAPLALAGEASGSMPISIEQYISAGALAATVRDPCGTCKHFDRAAWQKHAKLLRSSYEGKQTLNSIMAELLVTQNVSVQEMHTSAVDGEFDTDHAVAALGICHVLSELHNDLVIVHPLGVCPPEMRSAQKPRGMYESVDNDSERAGGAAFDTIMRAAQKGEKL